MKFARFVTPLLPRALGLALIAVFAVGCAAPRVSPNRPGPEGLMSVLSPESGFNFDAPPKDWIISTDNADGRAALSTVTFQDTPALELKSSETATIAVRRVDAMLLATPFLSWSWNLSDHGPGIHPVRIVVGFSGGVTDGQEAIQLGGGLPPHDRALALVWGDTLLKRGTLSLPPPENPTEAPLYTVRGGRENTRRWWPEAVDLSQFYAQAWPTDDRRKVRIRFIGIAAAPKMPTVHGRVSGILLSH